MEISISQKVSLPDGLRPDEVAELKSILIKNKEQVLIPKKYIELAASRMSQKARGLSGTGSQEKKDRTWLLVGGGILLFLTSLAIYSDRKRPRFGSNHTSSSGS